VRRGVGHAPTATRRTEAPTLARERGETRRMARATAELYEPIRENAALQVATELARNEPRAPDGPPRSGAEGTSRDAPAPRGRATSAQDDVDPGARPSSVPTAGCARGEACPRSGEACPRRRRRTTRRAGAGCLSGLRGARGGA
jgi:hypothetical protein